MKTRNICNRDQKIINFNISNKVILKKEYLPHKSILCYVQLNVFLCNLQIYEYNKILSVNFWLYVADTLERVAQNCFYFQIKYTLQQLSPMWQQHDEKLMLKIWP